VYAWSISDDVPGPALDSSAGRRCLWLIENEDYDVETFRSDEESAQEQLRRLAAVKASRNDLAVQRSLERLRVVASNGDNVMPAMIEAEGGDYCCAKHLLNDANGTHDPSSSRQAWNRRTRRWGENCGAGSPGCGHGSNLHGAANEHHGGGSDGAAKGRRFTPVRKSLWQFAAPVTPHTFCACDPCNQRQNDRVQAVLLSRGQFGCDAIKERRIMTPP